MKFKSKTEAYVYAIYVLEKIALNYSADRARIESEIELIRQCVEDHEQDQRRVARILRDLSGAAIIRDKDSLILRKLAKAIDESTYEQTPQEKWENPLGRRFESQLQIEMLQRPTQAMMASVKKISSKVVEILEASPWLRDDFMKVLEENNSAIAFGSSRGIPNYDEVRDKLLQNNPAQLADIMHAHFKFAQWASRRLSGEYASIASVTKEVADTRMYRSGYYVDRGREGKMRSVPSSQMGLIAFEGGLYNEGLPVHGSRWVPDAKAQAADLRSPFVRSLNDNDTPYVAGPSGMTSIFMGQMLGFSVLPTAAERQCYVASVTAYMVSGGFHSLHEVLGPIAHCLPEQNLVPGYRVSGEVAIQQGVATPPNFSAFYQNMAAIDPGFSAVRRAGWQKLNAFMDEKYIPHVQLRTYETMSADFGKTVLDGIERYQGREKGILFHLNPDKEKGIVRADNYKKMIKDAETDFEKLVITYALLATKNGEGLKKHVATKLGFSTPEEARKDVLQSIEVEVKKRLDAKFPLTDENRDYHAPLQQTRFANTIRELDRGVVEKIVLCTNTKKLYTSPQDRGEFTQPLALLRQIQVRLEQPDLPTQIPVINSPRR